MKRGNRGFGEIGYDYKSTREEKEKLRRLEELKNYVVKVPEPSGSGLFHEQIAVMAQTMVNLYNETQALISASIKLIETIELNFKVADERIDQIPGVDRLELP